MTHKVIVIGLDSATFRFIKPYAKDGWLPNLNQIMSEGVTRILKSTVPPISPPAWTSFLTGKNPGQHGIFHFADMDFRNYSYTCNRVVNSGPISGNTFIDFISEQNLKVGVVKIPFTYPPWRVNGFMVAGEPSPDWTKAHTYPPELSEKIGRVNIGSSVDFMRYNTEDLFKHLEFDCQVRTRISCEMMENDAYDFFMLVHNITDAASHRFWKFTDETVPNYKRSFAKYKNIIRDVYIEADKSIGKILEKIGPDTTVFLMSDHGATRKPRRFFHIKAWMKEMGYLQNKGKISPAQYVHLLLTQIKNTLPPVLRQLVTRTIKTHLLKNVSSFHTMAANFDWANTKAYPVNLYTNYDGIVINLKGRQPEGIVESGAETEQCCDEIQTALLKIKDPRNGEKIINRVYRREKVFKGKFSERMPDLIIQYIPDYRSDRNSKLPLFSDVPKTDFDFQSGDHDENGIFIAFGPHIRRGLDLPHRHIQDMALTILYAMGLPLPTYMDGEVMLDIFDNEFVNQNPINKITREKKSFSGTFELNKEEEDTMKEQLKGLGYM